MENDCGGAVVILAPPFIGQLCCPIKGSKGSNNYRAFGCSVIEVKPRVNQFLFRQKDVFMIPYCSIET